MIQRRKRDAAGCSIFAFGLAVLFSLQQTTAALAAEVVFGLQLNDDAADTYGSSLSYDPRTHRLYITGGTYSEYFKSGVGGISRRGDNDDSASKMSDCFFGVLQLPQQVFMSPQWIRRAQIGLPGVSEACSALYVSQLNGDIYLLGHSTHSASVLSPLENQPSSNINQTQQSSESSNPTPSAEGLLVHLTRGASLVGGALMNSDPTTYPIAIQGDAKTDQLFVASVKSNDYSVNPDFENLKLRSQTTHMDMSTAGYLPPEYGSNYTIVVKSMQRKEYYEDRQAYDEGDLDIHETLKPTWTKEFGMDTPKSIQVSGLLHVSNDVLVISGSTHRSQSKLEEDFDGFLLFLNPESGEQVGAHRIRSIPHGDDRILGMCKDETDSDNIYVVGITESEIHYFGMTHQSEEDSSFQQGAYRAFILKLNVNTLDTVWVAYVDGKYNDTDGSTQPPQVHGMACAVTPDGDNVYLSGTVKGGAAITFKSSHTAYVEADSHGGDDIFIAQYEASDGTMNFAKQLGTMYDDSLGQGVSLVTNSNGDAIILGNTNGSLMRQKMSPQTTDMFVLSLARKKGHHLPFYEMMTDFGPTTSSQGVSKSTNPYYVDTETDNNEPVFAADVAAELPTLAGVDATSTESISDLQAGQVSANAPPQQDTQNLITSTETTLVSPVVTSSPGDSAKATIVKVSVTRAPEQTATMTSEPTTMTAHTVQVTVTSQPTQPPTNETSGTPLSSAPTQVNQTQVNQTHSTHFKDAPDSATNETLIVKTNETTLTVLNPEVNKTTSTISELNATDLFQTTTELLINEEGRGDNTTQNATKDGYEYSALNVTANASEVPEDDGMVFIANTTEEVLPEEEDVLATANMTSPPPTQNPEEPSYGAESGAISMRPPEVYNEPSTLPSIVGTTENPRDDAKIPQPTEEIVEKETNRPTSNLRSQPPGISPLTASPMPTSTTPTPQATGPKAVLVLSSGLGDTGDEDSTNNGETLMPHVIAFIVLGITIVVVGMIALYFYRRRLVRQRSKRILPGRENKSYPEIRKEFVHTDSDATEVLEMMGEERWRTGDAEASDEERDGLGSTIEYSESYETQDGLLIMEMRPPQRPEAFPQPPPPMPTLSECPSDDCSNSPRHVLAAFSKGQDFCRARLWDGSQTPALLGQISPSFSSVVDISEDSVDDMDKYAKEEQPGDIDYIDKYAKQSPS